MKKIFSILTLVMVAGVSSTYAQYAGDALRFSQTNYGSSARFKAMGNAQIGVGGDASSLGGNPAGLGMFTRSEFTFTPEFNGTNIDAKYLNNNTSSSRNQININQFGAVFYMPAYRYKGQDTHKGVISTVIGLGYNRNNDYGLEANYSGINKETSIYNMFGDYSVPANSNQVANVLRTGSVSEFNIVGALNISNQVYIGASLGVVSLRYDYSSMFDEDGIVDNYYINYNQNQTTEGSGINAKFGIIFKPIPELRLGVNLQTPTWNNIKDSYTESSNDSKVLTSETYDFNYDLRTPLKGSLGVSYIIGNSALLSADVDFVDYSTISFSSSDGGNSSTIADNNNSVRASYKSAANYRLGAEFKVNSFVSLRAGYGVNGSAYKDDKNNYFQTQFYSSGVGYRNKSYSFDLAYQRVQTHTTFSPYLLPNYKEPVADTENIKNNFFLTFGIKF